MSDYFYRLLRDPAQAATRAAFALILLMLLLQLLGTGVFTALAQTPEQLAQGQWWRLLTSHLVHFSWSHLWMNLAAFALIALVLMGPMRGRDFLLLLAANAILLGLLLNYLNPEYAPYAGFSGLLHMLLVFALVRSPFYSRLVKALALGLILAKIASEQQTNFTPSAWQANIGAEVAVDAHLYGVGLGFMSLALAYLINRKTARTHPAVK